MHWSFFIYNENFSGMGIVLAGPTLISTIGIYFNKHRGLANSIVAGSASVGGLIFAPVFTTLFEEYGYTGAMIIVGGFLLNTFVTAALMRHPSWFKSENALTSKDVNEKLLEEQTEDYPLHISEEISIKQDHKELNHQENFLELYSLKSTQEDHSYHCEGHSCRCDKEISSSPYKENPMSSASKKGNSKTCFHSVKASLNDVIKIFEFKLLKDINCILYLLMAFFTVSGMALIPFYLPPFAKDASMSYDEIAIMVSTTACVEFVSKISSGVIADRQWILRSTLLALGAFVTGTLCQFARYYNSQTLIMVMASLMGKFMPVHSKHMQQ